jgi:hypothetical protein
MAGGAARKIAENRELGLSDIDVFFPNEDIFKWAVEHFENFRTGRHHFYSRGFMDFEVARIDETPAGRIVLLKMPEGDEWEQLVSVQLSKKKYYTSIQELFDDFDFTVSMFATDGDILYCADEAMEDLRSKTLILNPQKKPTKPKAARFAKYCEQGFMPGPGVIRAMLGVDCPQFFATANLKCDEY